LDATDAAEATAPALTATALWETIEHLRARTGRYE